MTNESALSRRCGLAALAVAGDGCTRGGRGRLHSRRKDARLDREHGDESVVRRAAAKDAASQPDDIIGRAEHLRGSGGRLHSRRECCARTRSPSTSSESALIHSSAGKVARFVRTGSFSMMRCPMPSASTRLTSIQPGWSSQAQRIVVARTITSVTGRRCKPERTLCCKMRCHKARRRRGETQGYLRILNSGGSGRGQCLAS